MSMTIAMEPQHATPASRLIAAARVHCDFQGSEENLFAKEPHKPHQISPSFIAPPCHGDISPLKVDATEVPVYGSAYN